jgi:hypothetical protein
MDKKLEKSYAERAVNLGRTGNPEILPELIRLVAMPSSKIKKFAVSAIGKLAGMVDADSAVKAIAPVLNDLNAQTRQYAIKALSAYGGAAQPYLHNLQDIADNPLEKEYNHRDATLAIQNITEALRIEAELAEHICERCSVIVDTDEYTRSRRMFQRIYCDKCFDETYLRRRNWESKVEVNKTIRTKDGTLVQSDGERRISEWLARHNIAYRYDERFRIIEGYAIRPDFYLPEFDLYIKYWGMDTAEYKIGMLKKQQLYQQQGKKLLSLYFYEKDNLEQLLSNKLHKYLTF